MHFGCGEVLPSDNEEIGFLHTHLGLRTLGCHGLVSSSASCYHEARGLEIVVLRSAHMARCSSLSLWLEVSWKMGHLTHSDVDKATFEIAVPKAADESILQLNSDMKLSYSQLSFYVLYEPKFARSKTELNNLPPGGEVRLCWVWTGHGWSREQVAGRGDERLSGAAAQDSSSRRFMDL